MSPGGAVPPPPGTARLFAAGDAAAALADPCRGFALARLLEDGDSRDLAWLVDRCGEAHLATWLAHSGGRALSRRSRAFWALVLDTTPGAPAPGAGALWPL